MWQGSFLKVLTIWAAGLGSAAQFAKFSVVFPSIQAIYPDAGPELGFAVSVISFVGLLLGLAAGLVAAQLSLRRLLIWALLLGAALSLFQTLLPSLPVMVVSRVIEGISHLVIVVAAPTLIAQITPTAHRAAALTLWGTFFGVAFVLVAWFGIPLVAQNGPSALFFAHAAYMLAMAGLVALVVERTETGRMLPNIPGVADFLRLHGSVYRSPFLAAPAFGWLFYAFSYVGLVTVLPGLVPEDLRLFTVAAMPFASIVSALTIGVWMIKRFGAIQTCVIGFALAIAVLLSCFLVPVGPVQAVALFAVLGLVQSASFAAVPELNNRNADRAYANGALAQMGNLGNAFGTPVLLFVLTLTGVYGLLSVVILAYTIAISAHLSFAKRRRTEVLTP